MTEKIETRVYKTADMTLAATLILKGMRVLDVEQIPEKRRHDIYRFVFEDCDNRQALILAYTSNELLVEPKALMNNVRSLKQLIKEKKKAADDTAEDS